MVRYNMCTNIFLRFHSVPLHVHSTLTSGLWSAIGRMHRGGTSEHGGHKIEEVADRKASDAELTHQKRTVSLPSMNRIVRGLLFLICFQIWVSEVDGKLCWAFPYYLIIETCMLSSDCGPSHSSKLALWPHIMANL